MISRSIDCLTDRPTDIQEVMHHGCEEVGLKKSSVGEGVNEASRWSAAAAAEVGHSAIYLPTHAW